MTWENDLDINRKRGQNGYGLNVHDYMCIYIYIKQEGK